MTSVLNEATLALVESAATRLRPIKRQLKVEGQCMAEAASGLLRQPLELVPPRLEHQTWHEWADQVEAKFAVKLRILDADQLPPPNSQPWVAVYDWGSDAHAEFAIGARPAAVVGIVLEPQRAA